MQTPAAVQAGAVTFPISVSEDCLVTLPSVLAIATQALKFAKAFDPLSEKRKRP